MDIHLDFETIQSQFYRLATDTWTSGVGYHDQIRSHKLVKIHVDLPKLRKSTNFLISESSKFTKIAQITTENGAVEVQDQILQRFVSKSTWIFSKLGKPKSTNFQLSESQKKLRIGPVDTENGTAEVSVGIDLELSQNPRGSSGN